MRRMIFTLAAVLAITAAAQVRLPQVLGDNMVVQHGQPVALWGWAAPGYTVNADAVSVTKGQKYKAKASAVADSLGEWKLTLPAMPAGSEYEITIDGQKLTGVLSGNVYLCSGQSNMELPVARVTDMFADEIAEYSNPAIRQFNVPSVVEFHEPQTDLPPTQWLPLDADHVMQFSALAYFLAKEMYQSTGLPVGILNSSWGGTPVEAWISEEYLQPYPRALNIKKIYEDDAYRENIKKLESQNFARWDATLDATDPGLQAQPRWYEAEIDDSDWVEMPLLSGKWTSDGVNPNYGSHWWRHDLELPKGVEDEEAMLRLGCIVDADSVFVNGKFVGNITYQYPPRKYKLPKGLLHQGKNNITIRHFSQHGTPHFVAEKPYKLIVGDTEYSLADNWRYRRGAVMPEAPSMEFFCYKPTVLYNAMIHPLTNLPLAGAVWYQGESNVERYNEYGELLQTMMECWRDAFNDDELPFYIVELADFLLPEDRAGRQAWDGLRKQQAKAAASTCNAYLIKNSDLGEWNDIHPLDKKTLARRIATAINAH